MVKSTVRFSETVMDRVEELVSRESFSSKSEFQRFAVEFVLSEIDDYEPEMIDFEDVRDEVFPRQSLVREPDSVGDPVGEPGGEFYQVAARVRQFASRGEIETARDLIDTHYAASDPRCMILDDIVEAARHSHCAAESTSTE
jgi:Arc/MetJ-type ribon-helix-helix transcriptional regulator